MFLVGGVLTILWAVIILLYLPPDPIRAKGFSERERYIAVARLRVNNAGVRNTHFKVAHARELLLDEKFWLVFVMALLSMVAAGPVNAFAPIIIAGFGYSTLNSLLLLMPAGAIAGLMILAATFIAYKVPRFRIWVIFVCQMITVLSALLLWLLPRDALGGLLFALYILAGFTGGWGVLMGLTIANAAGYTKRMLASSGVYIGYCLGESCKYAYHSRSHELNALWALGQFIGPLLFRPRDAPSYGLGFAAVVITAAATAVLALAYRYICVWHNRCRDGAGIMESFEHAYEDDVTDKKVLRIPLQNCTSANMIYTESSISLFSLRGSQLRTTLLSCPSPRCEGVVTATSLLSRRSCPPCKVRAAAASSEQPRNPTIDGRHAARTWFPGQLCKSWLVFERIFSLVESDHRLMLPTALLSESIDISLATDQYDPGAVFFGSDARLRC